MTQQTQDPATSVSTSIVVDAPIAHAFEVFTTGMRTWWNADHHIIEAPFADMVFEPRVGGNIYDVGTDGSECRWSRVLAYDPPSRVVFSWDINPNWQLEADPDRTSEIEVKFASQGPTSTLVELEHRHLDRHGDGWEELSNVFTAPDAWSGTLKLFAAAAAG
jgi:uncharacterized protein YndB with AHSA1/START domain